MRKFKTVGPVLVMVTVIALVAVGGVAAQKEIIYDHPGNTLIAYGGDKIPGTPDLGILAWGDLQDTDINPYGDGDVKTHFQASVEESYDGGAKQLEVADGYTLTRWGGSDPQLYSDEIELDESWTFHGTNIIISFPPGYSGMENTVTWSGEVTSGSHYALEHDYSGIAATADNDLNGVTQASNGSHLFQGTGYNRWVSANAHDDYDATW